MQEIWVYASGVRSGGSFSLRFFASTAVPATIRQIRTQERNRTSCFMEFLSNSNGGYLWVGVTNNAQCVFPTSAAAPIYDRKNSVTVRLEVLATIVLCKF